MVERRRFDIPTDVIGSAQAGRVIEHDMDMRRARPDGLALGARLAGLLRWLMPDALPIVSPMRSVAREIEETWPSRDR